MIHNSFLKTLLNIPKAVERLLEAKNPPATAKAGQAGGRENIAIWGDYDGDGISAAVLLYEALAQSGFKIKKFLLPNRYKIGIGLKEDIIKKLAKEKINLLITADFGIANIKESEFAKKNGIDLIILDHHLTKEKLPQGIAVDPKQKGEKYPYKELTAAGVAYKFIEYLFYKLKINKKELEQFIDLVAISIITDRAIISGENKKILENGIKQINKKPRLGIKICLDYLKIKKLDKENILKLANLISNPQNCGKNNTLFKLYEAKNIKEAESAAKPIIKQYIKIENAIKKSWQKADSFFKKNPPKKVIIWKENLNIPNLRGIIATKFYEKYNLPAFIYGSKDKKSYKVSARAPKGYNIIQAFENIKKVLNQGFGGHVRAAGAEFSIKNEKQFIESLKKYYNLN